MYVQTPKRPNLPPTPSCSVRTALPPISSILYKDGSAERPRLPSLDSFNTPSKFSFQGMGQTSTPSKHTLATPSTSKVVKMPNLTSSPALEAKSKDLANTSMDISESDISIDDSMIKPASKKRVASSESKAFAFISHSPATFPSQEPSIDNAPLARRKRRRTSPTELAILNQEFELGSTPNKMRRIEISKKVSMSEKAVQIWFQNKRQSLRKQSNNDKEVCELPPTPDSTLLVNPASTDVILPQSHLAPPLAIVSSTPTKPVVHRFQSQPFIQSPHRNQSTSSLLLPPAPASPIKARSSSTSNIHDFHFKPVLTPINTKVLPAIKNAVYSPSVSTPPTTIKSTPASFPQNVDDSIDTSNINTGLVLNETKKKQPVSLNSNNSSTMTFKLAPAKVAVSSEVSERKPLGELSVNVNRPTAVKNESECVENLLSLRAGHWK